MPSEFSLIPFFAGRGALRSGPLRLNNIIQHAAAGSCFRSLCCILMIKASATQCFTGALLRMLRHGGSQTCAVESADAPCAARQERRGVLELKFLIYNDVQSIIMTGTKEIFMEKRQKLKIGVIGCGAISERRHLPEYAVNPDVEITALYNRTRSKAEEMQKRYGGVVCSSVEELVGMDLDAVSVCTANTMHAHDTILALRAGKHVLCEKPMDVTIEKCSAMVEEAKKSGKLLMIAQNQRFSAAHKKAHDLIAEGAIGKVLSFETKFGHAGPERWTGTEDTWFFRKSEAGMGALADLGIHKTDLVHYVIGEPITRVYAHTATLDKRYPDGNLIDVEDNAWCIYRTDSDATGTMHVSWTDYGQEYNSIVVHGTRGSIRCYDDREYSLILETDDGRQNFLSTEDMITNNDQTVGTGKNYNSGVIDEFVECIRTGRPCRCTGEDALMAMRVIFAALESSKSGRMITIKENQ